MLFKLTVPAVFMALLLNTLAANGADAASPSAGPIILCNGADDTTSALQAIFAALTPGFGDVKLLVSSALYKYAELQRIYTMKHREDEEGCFYHM
ncbi:hypothetical protein BDP27DRAFT_1412817 [Rhodocollybia butyracea]|uniref:Uncharacterized protein n=1 Tax=Rhodocollybia butyracea TaxID=206335 RepID=A0A9P5QAW1_9AGAR|nr:hypothetical protein BDP27DRAFT_1412817 [Rhodocollybia butyracea]